MSNIQKSIDSILDTPKVEGIILFDLDGKVHFEQVPDYVDADLLEKLPQRILTMYDVIADNTQNCSDFILKFNQKNLYFRKSMGKKYKNFVLAVIGDAGINFISLKLITNLAMKMIELDETDKQNSSKKKKKPRTLTYRGQKIVAKNK